MLFLLEELLLLSQVLGVDNFPEWMLQKSNTQRPWQIERTRLGTLRWLFRSCFRMALTTFMIIKVVVLLLTRRIAY